MIKRRCFFAFLIALALWPSARSFAAPMLIGESASGQIGKVFYCLRDFAAGSETRHHTKGPKPSTVSQMNTKSTADQLFAIGQDAVAVLDGEIISQGKSGPGLMVVSIDSLACHRFGSVLKAEAKNETGRIQANLEIRAHSSSINTKSKQQGPTHLGISIKKLTNGSLEIVDKRLCHPNTGDCSSEPSASFESPRSCLNPNSKHFDRLLSLAEKVVEEVIVELQSYDSRSSKAQSPKNQDSESTGFSKSQLIEIGHACTSSANSEQAERLKSLLSRIVFEDVVDSTSASRTSQ